MSHLKKKKTQLPLYVHSVFEINLPIAANFKFKSLHKIAKWEHVEGVVKVCKVRNAVSLQYHNMHC